METRPVAAVALVAVLVLAGCSAGYQPAASSESESEPAVSAEPGATPDGGLDVDAADGLTDAELEAVVGRAMARVETLRGLEFKQDVEVELVTREEYREEYGGITVENGSGAERTVDNAQFEAMFLVGPDEDVREVRRDNRGDNVLGFYRPGSGDIVLVSESEPATLGDELTLAHELDHALQDQHFDLSTVGNRSTLDGVNARNGLVEGDALVVQQAYERRCGSEWDCVGTDGGSGGGAVGEDFHFGVYYVGFFPYAEGPSFVRYHRQRGGWDAVDATYDDPPATSAAVVEPATYGTGVYGEATLSDRSDRSWDRVTVGGEPAGATVGQAGLASMFAYTFRDDYAPNRSVVDRSAFVNTENGRLDPERPFTYDVRYADGWYADRLHAYERGDETAYVWNVTFQDRENASEFERGHERVLEHWGGRPRTVSGETVWTFDDGPFDGAVWVRRDGASLTVVKAPTVEELSEVYASAPAPTPAATAATATPAATAATAATAPAVGQAPAEAGA